MIENEVISIIKELNYKVEKLGDHFYVLYSKELKMILKGDPYDKNFIEIQSAFAFSGISDDEVYKVMNRLNVQLKFVKFFLCQDALWASYEREIHPWDDLKEVIKYMLFCMLGAAKVLNDFAQGVEPKTYVPN